MNTYFSNSIIANVTIIGLTGAMGCGKSMAAKAMQELGCEVIDADKLCHDVMDSDTEISESIKKLLGEDVYEKGKAIRSLIAKRVFAKKELLIGLEKILHPAIEKIWQKKAQELANDKTLSDSPNTSVKKNILVIEVPLLFEKRLENNFDICMSIYCSDTLRKKRLLQRGMTNEQILERDAFQLPSVTKAMLADIVLFNESDLDFLKKQAALVISRL